MMDDVEEEILLLLALCDEEEQNRVKKRIWVHELNKTRKEEGEFSTLYPVLRAHEERFYMYFRMTPHCFDTILDLIKENIQKQVTNYREPIGPMERLAITLRFLATGDSLITIGHSFRMGFSTISKIIKETCEAIWTYLQPIYMPEPTMQQWESIISGFQEKWQFPNCIGSIDGKHVTIKRPPNSGSNYFCYLQKYSLVLLAVVDFDYKFVCIDVGGYGKSSDGGIFETSAMGKRLREGSFNIPPNRPLPGQHEDTPCVLIGDEAFALSSYLMRPFPYRQSRNDIRKENYNKRLCRARRVVENGFGILAQKWRIFYRPLELKVNTCISVVKAACVLHNYLRITKSDANFTHLLEPPQIDIGAFQNLLIDGRRAPNFAFQLRERFVKYLQPNLFV